MASAHKYPRRLEFGCWLALLYFFDMLTRRVGEALVLGATLSAVVAAPPGFPASGNGMWYNAPSGVGTWSEDWLPIGNGFLGGKCAFVVSIPVYALITLCIAMLAGQTVTELTQLNIESLWSGGPFQDPVRHPLNTCCSHDADGLCSYRTTTEETSNRPKPQRWRRTSRRFGNPSSRARVGQFRVSVALVTDHAP